MNAYHLLDEMLHGLSAARERFENALVGASQEAAEIAVQMRSADETVGVTVRGDFSLESVSIDERSYGQQNAASLRAAILDAYRNAVFHLSRQQQLMILKTVLPVEGEQT